jgi:hypothetical protein
MIKRESNIPQFDDFLGLGRQSFEQTDLLIFHGVSGAGKSSNLKFLAYHHPFFRDMSVHWIWTKHKRFNIQSVQSYKLVVVDEIVSPIQLPAVYSLLKTNQTVAIASHISPMWFKLFFRHNRTISYQTDASTKKLSNYLKTRGIPHSTKVLRQFANQYGSNYVDLQCMLEAYPCENFDDAFRYNQKFNNIKCFSPKEWNPTMPRLRFH